MVSQQLVKENFYQKAFERSLSRETTPWLRELRERAFTYFLKSGFPTLHDEEWKYTNVNAVRDMEWTVESAVTPALEISKFIADESRNSVVVFSNGRFDRDVSDLSATGQIRVLSFAEASGDERLSEIFKAKLDTLLNFEKNGFTALNTAFIDEGALIYIPKNEKIDAPIQLLFLSE